MISTTEKLMAWVEWSGSLKARISSLKLSKAFKVISKLKFILVLLKQRIFQLQEKQESYLQANYYIRHFKNN